MNVHEHVSITPRPVLGERLGDGRSLQQTKTCCYRNNASTRRPLTPTLSRSTGRGSQVAFALVMLFSIIAQAQTQPTTKPTRPDPTKPIDLSTNKTLYVVGYSHLDTQWRW